MFPSQEGRWAGHVARGEEKNNAFKVFVENLKAKDHLDDLGIEGRVILK